MKKIIALAFFALSAYFVQAGEPTIAETTVRFNSQTNTYEVFARFDDGGKISFGGSMITIVLPEETSDMPLVISAVNGGGWTDGSRSYNVDGKDYHGIITSGQGSIDYVVDTEIKLFEFTTDASKVSLWTLGTDLDQTPDGTDYISNFYIPKTGFYIIPSNYGDAGTTDVKDLEKGVSVQVFPNPTTDKIQVSIENQQFFDKENLFLRIYESASGREVVLQKVALKQQYEIDVTEYPSGTYSIQFSQKNHKQLTTEFVKINL